MHSRASRCLVMVYLNGLQFPIFNHAKAFKLQCSKHLEIQKLKSTQTQNPKNLREFGIRDDAF